MLLPGLYRLFRSAVKLMLGRGVRRSYSQDGEDILVSAFLRQPDGVYVDVGAYHPVLYSNTYMFYKRGWRGVVVDPNTELAPLYRLFRPRDAFVRAAVGKEAGSAEYHRFSDGAYNTLSLADAGRAQRNKNLRYLGAEKVLVRPLRELLHEAGIKAVDFLTIDVEGMDVEVLESYDWSMPPRVIAVEDNAFDAHEPSTSSAFRFLVSKGYRLVAYSPRTLIFEQGRESRTERTAVV